PRLRPSNTFTAMPPSFSPCTLSAKPKEPRSSETTPTPATAVVTTASANIGRARRRYRRMLSPILLARDSGASSGQCGLQAGRQIGMRERISGRDSRARKHPLRPQHHLGHPAEGGANGELRHGKDGGPVHGRGERFGEFNIG